MQNKDAIRKLLNEKRLAVSAAERESAAKKAAELLTHSKSFIESQHIACYLARDHEFDCTPIIEALFNKQKNCYLPVLSQQKNHGLDFVIYRSGDTLQLNQYRILEPIPSSPFPPDKLDLVLLPLVGFDLKGNRLGMGKGYYDKTFAFLRNQTQRKPLLVGLAYEFQRTDTLPHDEWDIPLDGILTEERLIALP